MLIVLFISACDNDDETVEDHLINTSYFDTYVYLPSRIEIPDMTDFLRSAWTDDARIYFYYIVHGSNIVVANLSTDSGNIERREIPDDSDGYELFMQEYGEFLPSWEHPNTTLLADGRLIELTWNDGQSVLREVGMAASGSDEVILTTEFPVLRLFPAREDAAFDLLMDDGRYLFGYNLQTEERTLILNWLEAGFVNTQHDNILFLDDGRIAVLSQDWDGDDGFATELFILTPTPRADLPERVTLTLGGFSLSHNTFQAVVEFNRESHTHFIHVIDYNRYNTEHDLSVGFFRFQMDIFAGNGPDIIYNADETMAAAGILTDLYPFIDADPELSRTDFFLNVLEAMESPDGTLSSIVNCFAIRTMIGQTETVGHIDSWAFPDLLELMDTTAPYPLGFWMTGEDFVRLMTPEFVDLYTLDAKFNSDAFINLLEASRNLPASAPDVVWGGDYVSTYTHMIRGEQLLSVAFLNGTESYRKYSAALEDITALGMPTDEGGTHIIALDHNRVGINAASDRASDAWEFVRRTLLPTAHIEHRFPLRIDLYDTTIADAMTPRMETDDDGNIVEVPHAEFWIGGSTLSLFAMTPEEAQSLRALVDSAQSGGQFDHALWYIVSEELPQFFAGSRSAEDTARIIQNRVERFLSERERN